MDPAHRAFITGRRSAAAEQGVPVAIDGRCLTLHGIECRVCAEACGFGAIRFRPRRGVVAQPELLLDKCTRCGDCVPLCPAEAVSVAPR